MEHPTLNNGEKIPAAGCRPIDTARLHHNEEGIGAAQNMNPAQTVFRFPTHNDATVIPKSAHKEHMAENLDMPYFRLSADRSDPAFVGMLFSLAPALRTGNCDCRSSMKFRTGD